MSLSFLKAYMDFNHSWFILYLLSEKVVIDQLFANITGSGNDSNNINDDSNESNEEILRAEKLNYGKEK